MTTRPDTILIAGPTASGKSALAMELASEIGGVIVNADSMQVYAQLSIVTARPGPDDTAAVAHRLYGHVDGATAYSVALWLEDARQAVEAIREQGQVPILVGGTGLYFRAFEHGLASLPDIDPQIRAHWRGVAETTPLILHEELFKRDPPMASRLAPSDRQRLVRALEVYDSTGRSLLEWQSAGQTGNVTQDHRIDRHLVMPEREILHRRINERFERMIEAGALDEIERLLAEGLDQDLPVMKAIGVPQLAAYLRGAASLGEAIERAKTTTRRFAKRQRTWFRHQFDDSWRIRR